MGRKNDRNRQSRLQRKRNKRAAARAARRQKTDRLDHSPWAAATTSCISFCGGLLAGCGPLTGEVLRAARVAGEIVGGILGRLPFELNAFLHGGREWPVTCAELESVRDFFEDYDAMDAFGRLWTLSLTNEADPQAFASAAEQDCPHRAALAFENLSACLDAPESNASAEAMRAIAAEIDRHSRPGAHLAKTYQDLLHAAIDTVHAPAPLSENVLASFASQCGKVFNQHSHEQLDAAWWHCGRLFLTEVLKRLQDRQGITQTAAYADLARLLLAPSEAAVLLARSTGSAQPLRSIHFKSTAAHWRAYLERRIDAEKLAFDDRIRYEIARLKLLRAEARHSPDSTEAEPRDLLAAFGSLQQMLAHGVPPKSRGIPAHLDSPLVAFYVETIRELSCADRALQTTEEFLRQHPEDFRLACLCATGAALRGDHSKLPLLAKCIPRRHIDPELFAHCAMSLLQAPRGTKAALTLPTSLFDPLDEEHRKQCLIKLSQHCLRHASAVAGYIENLRALLPYFEPDNFVYRHLRERTAIESSLVFLATMMAPLLDVKLSLTEDQSQQWVSYAREIARQSTVGSQLAIRYLKAPTRSFALTPAVRNSACAQLSDFQPSTTRTQTSPPRPGRVPKKRRRAKATSTNESSKTQPGLFDAIDP